MRDATLVEPFAVQEIFVDGFSDHTITNGVMSCAGYRLHAPLHAGGEPHRVVVIRLVMPAHKINEAIEDARQAQGSPISNIDFERAKRH